MKKPVDLSKFNSAQLDKHFISLQDQMARRHGHDATFEAFLDCCVNAMCYNYNPDTMQRIRDTFDQEERYGFGEMLHCWIHSCNVNVTDDHSFHDFLGIMYERNAMAKQKGFAQYFTPEHICHLMASLAGPLQDFQLVAEPACGSGRLNLAAHAANHKLIHIANDLDFTCTKMAALNFLIHGVKGVVTADDGLFPKTAFKAGFIVNFGDSPNIQYVDDADTIYQFIARLAPEDQPIEEMEPSPESQPDQESSAMVDSQAPIHDGQPGVVSISRMGQQLSLF